MFTSCVQMTDVTKKLGNKIVVKKISLTVSPGEIIGIIGPNGAGKTTLLRILAALLTPDQGTLQLMGFDMRQDMTRIRHIIGYMPEDAGHYLRLSALENLKFHQSFYAEQKNSGKIEYFLKIFDLWRWKNIPVGKYSNGMKRKLLFIRSVIHSPSILLLDEPLTHLDPESQLVSKRIITGFIHTGKRCVFISSHSLAEIENMCSRIILLSEGKIIFNETVKNMHRIYKETMSNNLEDLYMTLMKND